MALSKTVAGATARSSATITLSRLLVEGYAGVFQVTFSNQGAVDRDQSGYRRYFGRL
jgi:hypothetical protein